MGFWKSLFGIESNSDNESEEVKSELDTTFVSNNEEMSFENSIYGSLQLYGAEVEYISEVLPSRGENLRKQIDLLTELLEKTNDEDDQEVREVFKALKKQFEEDKLLADGEYTISELEHQNRIMDDVFEKPVGYNSNGIDKNKLDEYISFISKVQKKVVDSENNGKPLLNKVQRQKFNNISMKSEYRIKMLELMYLLSNGDVRTNPFKDLSPTRQKLFSKLFYDDAKKAAEQYERLSTEEELFKNSSNGSYYFSSIDSMAKELNFQIANAKMIDDFSIRQLFDSNNEGVKSFDFLKRFVRFKSTINQMLDMEPKIIKEQEEKAAKKQKEEEEKRLKEEERQRKIQEEIEQYKNYTSEDIRNEIYRIEHDLTTKGSRFVKILDFQKKVARAKGLLETEANLQNENVVYKASDAVTAWEIIKKANTMGVSYAAFPDCQENRDGGFMIAASKEDTAIFSVERERVPYTGSRYSWQTDEQIGKYPGFILNKLHSKLEDDSIDEFIAVSTPGDVLYDVSIGYTNYSGRPSGYNKKKAKILETLQSVKNGLDDFGGSNEELQDVMCYVSVPATRNIIPILESFKKAEVTAYIEPVPSKNRNQDNRNNIQIYFERDQLKAFEEIVLPEISNQEVGIASLRWNSKSMGSAIKEELKWPKIKEKSRDEE